MSRPPQTEPKSLRNRLTQSFAREATPLMVIVAITLALGTAHLVLGATQVGVTTDEPTHVDRTNSWFETGWYVPERSMEEGAPNPRRATATPFVYGPAYSLLAHAANVALRNDDLLTEVAQTAEAYAVRHLVVALIALITVALAGVAVFQIARSKRLAWWTAACLLAIPVWTGHSFFNLKDVPTAAGYTMLTVALIVALRWGSGSGIDRRHLWLIAALAAGAFFIGPGTRLSMWVPFAISLAAFALLRLGQSRLGGLRTDRRADLALLAGSAAGILLIGAIYPNVAGTPFELLRESVSAAAGYPFLGFTLTAGQFLPGEPPAWYIPAWVGASVPVLIVTLALGGLLAGVFGLIRNLAPLRGGAIWSKAELGLVFVLLQATLLPSAAMVSGATSYTGVRQHLYVVPALAILAGYGAARAWRWARANRNAQVLKPLTATLLGLALLIPAVEQTLLFPYNYTYINPVAAVNGVEQDWETDYWFASAPEALSRVPDGAELRCSDFLVPGWSPDSGVSWSECSDENYVPYLPREVDASQESAAGADSLTWGVARNRGGNRPPDYCVEVDNVTRWVRGEEVPMSYVLRCAIPAEDS